MCSLIILSVRLIRASTPLSQTLQACPVERSRSHPALTKRHWMVIPYPVLDNAQGHLFRTGCCKPFKKRNPVGCRITKFTTFCLLFINNRFICFGLFCFVFNPGHGFGPCLCKNKNKRKRETGKFFCFALGAKSFALQHF